MLNDWSTVLKEEMNRPYFKELNQFINSEYLNYQIYPPKEQIYNAFCLTGYSDTKVVILGQDPYHGPGQAHGLSFSVAEESKAKFPPSLRNIFKELESDTGIKRSQTDLTDWAQQGVLLLNTVLTVRAGKAGSHRKIGWERFTDHVISMLNLRDSPVIFVLWGAEAQKKLALIDQSKHTIIMSAHPSPLSAYNGFWGSKPFSRINNLLEGIKKDKINW